MNYPGVVFQATLSLKAGIQQTLLSALPLLVQGSINKQINHKEESFLTTYWKFLLHIEALIWKINSSVFMD